MTSIWMTGSKKRSSFQKTSLMTRYSPELHSMPIFPGIQTLPSTPASQINSPAQPRWQLVVEFFVEIQSDQSSSEGQWTKIATRRGRSLHAAMRVSSLHGYTIAILLTSVVLRPAFPMTLKSVLPVASRTVYTTHLTSNKIHPTHFTASLYASGLEPTRSGRRQFETYESGPSQTITIHQTIPARFPIA